MLEKIPPIERARNRFEWLKRHFTPREVTDPRTNTSEPMAQQDVTKPAGDSKFFWGLFIMVISATLTFVGFEGDWKAMFDFLSDGFQPATDIWPLLAAVGYILMQIGQRTAKAAIRGIMPTFLKNLVGKKN